MLGFEGLSCRGGVDGSIDRSVLVDGDDMAASPLAAASRSAARRLVLGHAIAAIQAPSCTGIVIGGIRVVVDAAAELQRSAGKQQEPSATDSSADRSSVRAHQVRGK